MAFGNGVDDGRLVREIPVKGGERHVRLPGNGRHAGAVYPVLVKDRSGVPQDGVYTLPAPGLYRLSAWCYVDRFVSHYLYLVQQAPYNNAHFTTKKGKIGRASCRERVEIAVEAVSLMKK